MTPIWEVWHYQGTPEKRVGPYYMDYPTKTPEEALQLFRQWYKGEPDIIAVIDANRKRDLFKKG